MVLPLRKHRRKLSFQSNAPGDRFYLKYADKNDGSRHEKKAQAVVAGSQRTCGPEPQPVPIATVTNVNPTSLHYHAGSRLKKGRKDRELSAVKRDRGGLVRQG